MPDDHPPAASADPVRQLRSVARSVRLRLEDEGRAGRTAVGRTRLYGLSGSIADGAQPDASPPAEAGGQAASGSAAAPEARAAATLKEDLRAVASGVARTDELFSLGDAEAEGGLDRADALARLAAEVAACDRCKELAAGRAHTVPGQGSSYAKLVFIGEGPGEEEDRQGLAFVGRAGVLLTKMIESIGMTREQVFICNIVKCRPPQNRTPMPDEEATCGPYLMRQLEILKPRVICALGGVAAKWLLQTHDGITRLRGRFYPYRGTLLMPTFHPAYVLRNYTPDTRKKVYEDLLKIKAELAK